MAYNRVYNAKTEQVLYQTRTGFGDAIDWMMYRVNEFPQDDFDDIAVEEVQEDGEVTGWWSIDDLFDNNPNGWQLDTGLIIVDPREENEQ